jgi:hypothetical protein
MSAALRDLEDRFRGVPKPDGGGRLEELNRRLRQAYFEAAEEAAPSSRLSCFSGIGQPNRP